MARGRGSSRWSVVMTWPGRILSLGAAANVVAPPAPPLLPLPLGSAWRSTPNAQRRPCTCITGIGRLCGRFMGSVAGASRSVRRFWGLGLVGPPQTYNQAPPTAPSLSSCPASTYTAVVVLPLRSVRMPARALHVGVRLRCRTALTSGSVACCMVPPSKTPTGTQVWTVAMTWPPCF